MTARGTRRVARFLTRVPTLLSPSTTLFPHAYKSRDACAGTGREGISPPFICRLCAARGTRVRISALHRTRKISTSLAASSEAGELNLFGMANPKRNTFAAFDRLLPLRTLLQFLFDTTLSLIHTNREIRARKTP